jgi:hypothetical protein
MKIIELTDKILLPITNEEQSLLKRFSEESIPKKELSDREQVIANQLTIKNVLVRINKNGKIFYKKQIN